MDAIQNHFFGNSFSQCEFNVPLVHPLGPHAAGFVVHHVCMGDHIGNACECVDVAPEEEVIVIGYLERAPVSTGYQQTYQMYAVNSTTMQHRLLSDGFAEVNINPFTIQGDFENKRAYYEKMEVTNLPFFFICNTCNQEFERPLSDYVFENKRCPTCFP